MGAQAGKAGKGTTCLFGFCLESLYVVGILALFGLCACCSVCCCSYLCYKAAGKRKKDKFQSFGDEIDGASDVDEMDGIQMQHIQKNNGYFSRTTFCIVHFFK